MWPPVFLYGGFLVLAHTYRVPHAERGGRRNWETDLPKGVGCFFMPSDGSGRTTYRAEGGGASGRLCWLVGCVAVLIDWVGEDAPTTARGRGGRRRCGSGGRLDFVPHGVFFGKGRRGAAAGLRLIVYIIERIKEREEAKNLVVY